MLRQSFPTHYALITAFLILTFAPHVIQHVTAVPIYPSRTSAAAKVSADENASSFWPQFISMAASLTAGLSSILASQLSKRFPLSFHASSPHWFLPLLAVPGYLLIYFGLLLYGLLRDTALLSTTLALMAAPGVPLHGFLWALIPQVRQPTDPPATDGYIVQCFTRKNAALLFATWIPLIAVAIAAGVRANWQGVALQIAAGVAFIAAAGAPDTLPRARDYAFGRTGRHVLLPRPGARLDTMAYCVDLKREELLPPVRMEVTDLESYRAVEAAMIGPTGHYFDHSTATQRPVQQYLSEMVALMPTEKLGAMTVALWATLEAWKPQVNDPAMDFLLLYGLCERMAYVAFRPNRCTQEQRGIAAMLNFAICMTDTGSTSDALRRQAVQLHDSWTREGEEIIRSDAWKTACDLGANNPVDTALRDAQTLLPEDYRSDARKRHVVDTVGAVGSFVRHVFGHNNALAQSIVDCLPYYHNRIKADLVSGVSMATVCRGLIASMKRNGLLNGDVDNQFWAPGGRETHWGGGGFALLDQSYARNSALAYVGQLAIIVVKSVLEG